MYLLPRRLLPSLLPIVVAVLVGCGTTAVDDPADLPDPTSPAVPGESPTPSPTPEPEPEPEPKPADETEALDPRHDTCGEAIEAGYGPYRQGVDPEYDWYQDRDGDGVVCES